MAEGIDYTIESLKQELSELKQHISQCRKKGVDGSIADLRIASIPSKIKMLEATRDIRDVQRINALINQAKAEVEEMEKEVLNRQHKIIISNPDLLEIADMLDSVEQLAKDKRLAEAKGLYLKCHEIYQKLSEVNRKAVFDRIDYLRTMLTQA